MSAVFESIAPAKLTEAEARAEQAARAAALPAGGVGTYMFGNDNSGRTVYFGRIIAGYSLRPTTAGNASQRIHLPAISGSWRCMGYKEGPNRHFEGTHETSLWQRIA